MGAPTGLLPLHPNQSHPIYMVSKMIDLRIKKGETKPYLPAAQRQNHNHKNIECLTTVDFLLFLKQF